MPAMDALAALADPTRRRILELLRDGELAAGDLSDEFSISRPAVSRHLRVLREAELVHSRVDGQRRVYALDALDTEIRRGRRSRRTT